MITVIKFNELRYRMFRADCYDIVVQPGPYSKVGEPGCLVFLDGRYGAQA